MRDDDEHGTDDTDVDGEHDWSDDYIAEQLEQHDESGEHVAPSPTPMSRFRHGSIGLTLGAAMTGLGNVLEPSKKEEQAVIVEHDEPDQSNDRIEMHLDRDDPASSVVIIRKWIDEHPERKRRDDQ